MLNEDGAVHNGWTEYFDELFNVNDVDDVDNVV